MTQEYKSFSPEEFRLHNEKLQAEMEKQDIDMLMLSTPENIYYSTGYRSWYTSSLFRPVYVLVPRKGDPAIILRRPRYSIPAGPAASTAGELPAETWGLWRGRSRSASLTES